MALDLHATARRVGTYVWIEERLFEVLGAWVPTTDDPAVAARFAADCHHHAWHAQLWRDRRPEVPGPDPTVAPALAELMDRLGAAEAPVERLVGMYRVVLPRVLTAYAEHRTLIDPRLDEPTARILTLVERDEQDDRDAGEALLQARLSDPALAARAASWQAELDARAPRSLVVP